MKLNIVYYHGDRQELEDNLNDFFGLSSTAHRVELLQQLGEHIFDFQVTPQKGEAVYPVESLQELAGHIGVQTWNIRVY